MLVRKRQPYDEIFITRWRTPPIPYCLLRYGHATAKKPGYSPLTMVITTATSKIQLRQAAWGISRLGGRKKTAARAKAKHKNPGSFL